MRAAVHPYQLHGGVILVPAPQHHAHLTSRKGGKGKRKRKKRGEGAEAPARAPGRLGRPVRSRPLRPRPLRASPAPAAASPPPGAAAARAGTLLRSPAPALPGSSASLARSQPASPPPPNQTTPPASERPRLAARGPLGPRRRGVGAGGLSASSPARGLPRVAPGASTGRLPMAGAGAGGRGGEGAEVVGGGEVLNSFGEGVGRRSRLGRNRDGLMGRGLRERSRWLLGSRGS